MRSRRRRTTIVAVVARRGNTQSYTWLAGAPAPLRPQDQAGDHGITRPWTACRRSPKSPQYRSSAIQLRAPSRASPATGTKPSARAGRRRRFRDFAKVDRPRPDPRTTAALWGADENDDDPGAPRRICSTLPYVMLGTDLRRGVVPPPGMGAEIWSAVPRQVTYFA